MWPELWSLNPQQRGWIKTQLCSSEAFCSLSLRTCAPLGFYCANLLKGKLVQSFSLGSWPLKTRFFRSEITARSSADSSASSWCLRSFAQTVCLLFQPCSWYPELANTLKNKPTSVCWLTLPRDSPLSRIFVSLSPGYLSNSLKFSTFFFFFFFLLTFLAVLRGIPGLK